MRILACFAALLAFASPALAEVRTFKLDTVMSVQVVLCVEAKDPIAIHEALAKPDHEKAKALVADAIGSGKCAIVPVTLKFKRQVHKITTKAGDVLAVYEADTGGLTVYVPTENMLHETVDV